MWNSATGEILYESANDTLTITESNAVLQVKQIIFNGIIKVFTFLNGN